MNLQALTRVFNQKNLFIIGAGGLTQAFMEIIDQSGANPARVLICDKYADNFTCDFNIELLKENITQQNVKEYLLPQNFDIVLNLSNQASSEEIGIYCLENGIYYLDTAFSFWQESHGELASQIFQNNLIKSLTKLPINSRSFALINAGMNPGLISHIAQHALETYQMQWGSLPPGFNIIFSENDSQIPTKDFQGLHSTWSPRELFNELVAPSECYSGSDFCTTNEMAINSKMKSWTPQKKSFEGHLVTHREVMSFIQRLPENEMDKLGFSGFVYHPPSEATNKIANFLQSNSNDKKAFLSNDPERYRHWQGTDEIGVLIGKNNQWHWSGISLGSEETLKMGCETNPTLLLVALSALILLNTAIQQNVQGFLEAEDLSIDNFSEQLDLLNFTSKKINAPILDA